MRLLPVALMIVAVPAFAQMAPAPEEAPSLLAGEALPDCRVLSIPVLAGHCYALPRLLEGLQSPDADVRARCCFLLGQIAAPEARDPLSARLSDADRSVREFAGIALSRMGDMRGAHAAEAAYQGNRWWVRFWAVEALGIVGMIPAEVQNDPDPLVGRLAAEAREAQWEPFVAEVCYSGPADLTLDEVIFGLSSYLIAETDWWWHAGDYPQILRAQETILWLDPQWTEGYGLAGYLYWSLGRNTEAVGTYRRGVAVVPEAWETHFELGFYYYNAWKRYEEAVPHFARARELGAPSAQARLHAHALEHAGHPREALEVWRELLAADPNNGVLRLNIERLEAQLSSG